ncbi:bZIP transcription factor 11-like [Impatiens glandulifera]|uniref:bZIP transcription factor 11-like n=1 Tax=Impatiens glandulifera TaxID=253017 RepID=UPI001FB151C9|nr:bZIP transcription factor 11-like [Impatiens glandulifera]
MFAVDGMLGYHFPGNETGFFTAWESYETSLGFLPFGETTNNEPAISQSPLEKSCVIIDDDDDEDTDKNKNIRGNGSHDRTLKTGPVHLDRLKIKAGSCGKPGSVLDERRLKRMISNRDSARRSRERKQKHLDNLSDQMNRLRTEKKELANRLQSVLHQTVFVRRENDRFRSESVRLRENLWALRQILMVQELQQQQLNNSRWSSLVT